MKAKIIFSLLTLFLYSFALGGNKLGTPSKLDIEYPDEEAPSKELVTLGKQLFFDNRLSKNRNQSCATCHNPDLGFGDGLAKGIGDNGQRLSRNVPHIYNLAWNVVFMWDGREPSLESQALGPIRAEGEMNLPIPDLIKRLNSVSYYKERFNSLFENGVTEKNIAIAIAAFERTIISDNSAYDRYLQGDFAALSKSQQRGLELFSGKGRCILCHEGPNFTNQAFHNIGIGDSDPGRIKIQKGPTNLGAFKTPGLRNVILTAPYMHDGSLGTLEEVVQHYNKGGNKVKGLDPLMKPLNLNKTEVMDLVAFLGALTDPVQIERPQIP